MTMGPEVDIKYIPHGVSLADSNQFSADQYIKNTYGLIVGHLSKETVSIGDGSTDLVPEVQVLGTGQVDSSILLAAFSTTATAAGAPLLAFAKGGHATIGSHTVVTDGEELGNIIAFGDDGTDLEAPAAMISFEVDGTPGTGNMPGRILFATSAAGGETLAEHLRISAAGLVTITPTTDTILANGTGLIVGHTAGLTVSRVDLGATLTPEFQVLGTASDDAAALIGQFSADALGPSLIFQKSRHASIGSNTVVVDDDRIGTLSWQGADGGGNIDTNAAEIYAAVDGTPGTNDMPTRLVFSTTPDGSATPTERLRIDAAGISTFAGNVVLEKAAVMTRSELTIASGAITVTSNYHTVETEGDASTDILSTISGGTIGQFLFLQAADSTHDVTIKHGTGGADNIYTRDGNDLEMTSTSTPLLLIFDGGSAWRVVGGQAGL